MSIEYTIDIQLTELGFPDILQPQESADRETSSEDSFSPSHSPTPLSSSNKQSLLVRGADKQTSNIGQSTVSETLRCKPLNPAQSLQHEQDVKGTVLPGLSEATADHPAAGRVTADLPLLITVQDDKKEKNVDNYSDDSEVSEAYEEEEVEEDDEDEDGPSKESGLLGDYRCSVCDLQLPSKFRLQDHMNLHTGARPYCCAECGKRFCQIYNYRVHLRTHAQTKAHRHLCRVCRMGFASQEDLKDHVSRTHFEKEFYECDLCKHVFTSLEACKYHVQSHKCLSNVVCDVCGRNFSSPKYLEYHRKWVCHRTFKCTDCAKTFTKKNALLKHSFSHLGLLPYTCIRCQCHFRLARLYRQHKCEPERIHCVACLREFPSQGDFQQHKKDTGCWGNQEPKGDEIRCLECGQRFDTSDELKRHAGAHQRVLKCADCGKGFRSALLLMSHMGGHAGNSPCLCQSCGLGFPHQQNYDSHLKTCGQTPQPACAPKKRQASKSSSSRTKKASTKPDSSKPAIAATAPAAPAAPADVSDNSAAPAKDRCSPGLVTGGVSAGSGPPDGLWKLTLDKQPPAGAQLVLFLPVCPTEADGLTLPSVVSETQPGPAMQLQPDAALLSGSNEQLRLNAALGAPLNAPLDLVTGIKQDPECEAPLDLSKKSNSSKPAPLHPVKSEPEEFEITEEAESSERRAFGDSNAVVQTSPRDTYSEVRQFKLDSTDFPPLKVNSSSSGLTIDIKEEPLSPGPGSDSWSSTSCQLTENNMKMEVDISSSAHADIEK